MAKAIAPDGTEHHAVITALVVRDVDQAIEFYEKAFDAREILRIPGPGGKTGHGQVRFGDTILFLAREPENRDSYVSP
jgi:PhnB protein